MPWFKKNKDVNKFTNPKNMTPLEAVTHLCASIQLADGDSNYEEREAWTNAIRELFPEFSEERADRFLKEAQQFIYQKSNFEKINYVIKILERIKNLLNNDQINLLGPKLSELIEAEKTESISNTEYTILSPSTSFPTKLKDKVESSNISII